TSTTRDGVVKDLSGYERHAVLDIDKTPAWKSNSKLGEGCYYFDNDNYINKIELIEPTVLSNLHNGFSFSCWVSQDVWDLTSNQCIVSQGQSSPNNIMWNFGINSSGLLEFSVFKDGDKLLTIQEPVSILSSGWHHFV